MARIKRPPNSVSTVRTTEARILPDEQSPLKSQSTNTLSVESSYRKTKRRLECLNDGMVNVYSKNASHMNETVYSSASVTTFNPKFKDWVDSSDTNALTEWLPDRDRQLTEVPFDQWPGPKRGPKPAKTVQEYESGDEDKQAATLRVAGGKTGNLLVTRSMLPQSVPIDAGGYLAGIGFAQMATMQDRAMNLQKNVPIQGFEQSALGTTISARPDIQKTSKADVRASLSSIDFRSFEQRAFLHQVAEDPIRLPGEKLSDQKLNKAWYDLIRKKADQLIYHGLVVKDWQRNEHSGGFPIPIDETGQALLRYSRASDEARNALEVYMSKTLSLFDEEEDPMIWVCTGVGKKGGLKGLKISIERLSEAPTERLDLSTVITLCNAQETRPVRRVTTIKPAPTPGSRASKRIKTAADGTSYQTAELIDPDTTAAVRSVPSRTSLCTEPWNNTRHLVNPHDLIIDIEDDHSVDISWPILSETPSVVHKDETHHLEVLDFPLANIEPDGLRSKAQIRIARMLSDYVRREKSHQILSTAPAAVLADQTDAATMQDCTYELLKVMKARASICNDYLSKRAGVKSKTRGTEDAMETDD